jgi:hypothetical protein
MEHLSPEADAAGTPQDAGERDAVTTALMKLRSMILVGELAPGSGL